MNRYLVVEYAQYEGNFPRGFIFAPTAELAADIYHAVTSHHGWEEVLWAYNVETAYTDHRPTHGDPVVVTYLGGGEKFCYPSTWVDEDEYGS